MMGGVSLVIYGGFTYASLDIQGSATGLSVNRWLGLIQKL